MKTLLLLGPLVALTFAMLTGCADETSNDDEPSEGALASGGNTRLAKFAMATGIVATRGDATALRESIQAAGGKVPWPGKSPEVVAGFLARDLAGFEADDSRAFGIDCQVAGKYAGSYGPLGEDTCVLTAVVEIDAQKKTLGGKLQPVTDQAYEARITGKLAVEIAKSVRGAAAIQCTSGASATCTVQVSRGNLGDFSAILSANDALARMKVAEAEKLVGAFF